MRKDSSSISIGDTHTQRWVWLQQTDQFRLPPNLHLCGPEATFGEYLAGVLLGIAALLRRGIDTEANQHISSISLKATPYFRSKGFSTRWCRAFAKQFPFQPAFLPRRRAGPCLDPRPPFQRSDRQGALLSPHANPAKPQQTETSRDIPTAQPTQGPSTAQPAPQRTPQTHHPRRDQTVREEGKNTEASKSAEGGISNPRARCPCYDNGPERVAGA